MHLQSIGAKEQSSFYGEEQLLCFLGQVNRKHRL